MDTFELLPSLAQGELADTSAPELVSAVFRARASGTLWMEAGDSEIRCFFRAGDMCGTGSFKGFQTLAHVLLAHDWVAALDIESTREEATAKGLRHGDVLVQRGLLTHDQLRTALGVQHTANLATLLSLTSGRYDWRGWEPPPAWAREVVVDPVACVVDALELSQHTARRRKVLDWLGRHAARLSLDWPELEERLSLGPLDRRAAALLALPRTLPEFVQASRLPQGRAEALLVALLLAGGAEPHEQGAPARIDATPLLDAEPIEPEPVQLGDPEPVHLEPDSLELDEPEPPAALDFEPELELDEPEANPRRSAPPPRRALIDEREALSRLDSLSLDEPTPPPPAAPRPQDDEPLELDDRARDLRAKLRAQGLRNLTGGPRQEAIGGVFEEPEAAPGLETPLSPEDQVYADEVRSRSRAAQGQNAYARLGVSPAAPIEHLKGAYLSLLKRFHPDHAPPGLASIQPDLQKLFALLKEAWDQVGTPEARARYDAQLKGGGTTGRIASRKEESGMALKMGDVLLKKRDFEGAIGKLRRAVDLDASGDALAALAWALVADPKGTPQAKEEAAALVQRALRAQGASARTYYVAGVLWRTKDPDSAVDAFRKALELDPQHPDAALELRLIEQRRAAKGGKPGGGVLSGLLFGKRKS